MPSMIDPTLPVYGNPTTDSVRSNFQIAADEITALQAAVLAPPLTVSAGPAAVIPDQTYRVCVTTTDAVTLTLPHNDCLVLDRTGNRTNPILVAAPASATINGLPQYAMVNAWQAVNFLYDGAGFAAA